MTKDEIKAKLDDLGVEYASDALKAELEELLDAAEKPSGGIELGGVMTI